jgi:hypothetical protein
LWFVAKRGTDPMEVLGFDRKTKKPCRTSAAKPNRR